MELCLFIAVLSGKESSNSSFISQISMCYVVLARVNNSREGEYLTLNRPV